MGFQSTLPRGERLAYHLLLILFLLFQSTLPRGERRLFLVFDLFHRKFQSTLPRGERLCRICHSNNIRKNFNPRSHEGSDLCQGNCTLVQEISIHAPTRGATFIRDCEKAIGKISIHAPTRGATMLVMFDDCGLVFQSTLPRGERLRPLIMSALSSYFNPRSHEGSDLWRSWCSLAMRLFQSTLPRGERLGEIGKKDKTQVFQSTLPRGERRWS